MRAADDGAPADETDAPISSTSRRYRASDTPVTPSTLLDVMAQLSRRVERLPPQCASTPTGMARRRAGRWNAA